jgi:hypothetical protein
MRRNPEPYWKPPPLCTKGFTCPFVGNNRCKFQHHERDSRLSLAYRHIMEFGDAVIYLGTAGPCVLSAEDMPVMVRTNIKLEPLHFYEARAGKVVDFFLELEVVRDMGVFGSLPCELAILQRHYNTVFYRHRKMENDPDRGVVKVDGLLQKAIAGTTKESKRCELSFVNCSTDHRLLDGVEVLYRSVNRRKAYIFEIDFQRVKKQKFYGILRVNSQMGLEFVPRNLKMDTMTVQDAPRALFQALGLGDVVGMVGEGYSMLVKRPLNVMAPNIALKALN